MSKIFQWCHEVAILDPSTQCNCTVQVMEEHAGIVILSASFWFIFKIYKLKKKKNLQCIR